MWQCPKCGNPVEDNFDVCWSCGTSRGGVEDPAFRREVGAGDAGMSPTGAKTPSPASSASAPTAESGSTWSEAGLAALLLRLLGVYFMAWAIIHVVEEVTRLVIAYREFSLDRVPPTHWTYLSYMAAEFLVGLYFLIGGRWVYEKILTPITHGPTEDAREDDEAG
jgi:hypothetical protein